MLFTADRERLIGQDAINAMTTYSANAGHQAKRLLGRRFDDPVVQKDLKYWPFKVINDDGFYQWKCVLLYLNVLAINDF